MAAFGDFLDEVGDCVRRCLPRQVLVLGDFNARWSQWGDTRTNSRGRMLTDWAATLGLVLVNRSATSTCVAWRGSSIVDVAWATAELYRKIHGWRVADRMETLSDHLYIMMGAQMEAAARDRGARQREENRSRRPPPSTPRWRLKERDKDMLRAAVTVSAWSWDGRGNNPPPHYRHHIGKRRQGGGRVPRIHERGMRRLHATRRPGRQKRPLRVLVDTGNSRYASELRPGPEKISKGASSQTDTG